MRTANLIGHDNYDFKGDIEQAIFEWDGPKDGIIRISGEFLSHFCGFMGSRPKDMINETLSFGPYKLKCYETDEMPLHTDYLFFRTDSSMAYIKVFLYHSSRWFDLAYRRLIITAAVWRLAEYYPHQIPSWQDLYIVHWVKRSIYDRQRK
jgi:hypothetical protein